MPALLIALILAFGLQAPPSGTAAIGGVVTAADSGQPLPRAIVALSSTIGGSTRTVLTDEEGRFVFEGLASGRYRVGAGPGSVRAHYLYGVYGGERAGARGESVVLEAGRRFTDANIALARGGIVEGRVVGVSGEPLSGVRVFARVPSSFRTGVRPGARDVSDDHGRFRLYGLDAGQFILVAEPPLLTGVATDGESAALLRTFFPSAVVEPEATRIRVAAGAEVKDLTIRIRQSRLFTVSGSVTDSSGREAPWLRVALVPTGADLTRGTASVLDEGKFTIRDVLPGGYRLVVRSGPVDAPTPEHGPSLWEFGSVALNVAADVDGVAVTTAPGASVRGRITFAHGAPEKVPARTRVMAVPAERIATLDQPSDAAVGEDLRFTLSGMFGPLLVRVGDPPPGYALETVRIGTTDITDEPFDFGSAGDRSLEVVLTRRVASLEGLVTDAAGFPTTRAIVLLLPDGRGARTWQSARVRIGFVSGNGRVQVTDVLPGRYHAVAIPPGEADLSSASGAKWLESLLEHATPITLGAGDKRSVELRLLDGRQ